jgi:hypothetical protein
MPDIGIGAPLRFGTARVLQAVSELAEGGLGERMRMDAAVRILVTARRAMALHLAGRLGCAASATVTRIAGTWDPAATTAAEHVEALPVAQLDAFLDAAPAWAAGLREVREPIRKAA